MELGSLCKDKWLWAITFGVLVMSLFCGCMPSRPEPALEPAGPEPKVFVLHKLPAQNAAAFLTQLELGAVQPLPEPNNALAVVGPPETQEKVGVVLDLIDSDDEYMLLTLAPIQEARTVPANDQIAEAIGDITIGTFAQPPIRNVSARALIDIQGDSLIAIVPTRLREEITAMAKLGPEGLKHIRAKADQPSIPETEVAKAPIKSPPEPNEPETTPPVLPEVKPVEVLTAQILPEYSERNESKPVTPEPEPEIPTEPAFELPPKTPPTIETKPDPESPKAPGPAVEQAPVTFEPNEPERRRKSTSPPATVEPDQPTSGVETDPAPAPETGRIVVGQPEPVEETESLPDYAPTPLENGDDVLELDLPDKLELIQLLDLVAEYLNLDYMYEPEDIKDQSISLRLHGKLRGEVKVKELYPLLESVLKFKGFAMARHKDNLVTIVPIDKALDLGPTLLDGDNPTIGAGDVVVTRVFELQHVSTSSAMNLLEAMKLSVAASPIAETQTLIVTCYAYRIGRIERLLKMVDRPGRAKEFRFRQVQNTLAATLVTKVESIVAELQTVPISITSMSAPTASAPPTSKKSSRLTSGLSLPSPSASEPSPSSESSEPTTVYLDADERTNRILMIGHTEQLAIVESVIEALDVAQHDPRTLRIYNIIHIAADHVEKKLQDLAVIGKSTKEGSAAPPVFASKASSTKSAGAATAAEEIVAEDTQVTVLEATNALLIHATEQQHARIAMVIEHIDVAPDDLRALKVYDIKFITASDVKDKLADFGVIGSTKGDKDTQPASASTALPTATDKSSSTSNSAESATMHEPQVTVREATNSLVVNATDPQHARIAQIIEYVDVAPQDLRTLKVYDIQFIAAEEAKEKLSDFGVIGGKKGGNDTNPSLTAEASPSKSDGESGQSESATMYEPQVTVREATNSLVVNATDEQHARIDRLLDHIDVAQQDRRHFKVYEVKYVDAEEVKNKLEEFELIGKKAEGNSSSSPLPDSKLGGSISSTTPDGSSEESSTMHEPQVGVLESTNSLLVNATDFQHAQIASVITYVDTEVKQEAIPYEIYFLENQDPEVLAEVIGRLIQETVTSKDDKTQKPEPRRAADEIIIVPDKGTFSLIVYAKKKNQDWISKLIKALDRRRPQVLIDVTLVEIRKTNEFNYDLNAITSVPDLKQTSGQTGSFTVDDEGTTVIDQLLGSGASHYADAQSNDGSLTAFYGDLHVNALLTAVQTKDYGRVLAKPKVLVNDNEKGTITTTNTTYVTKSSSIPVSSGSAGSETSLIQTATEYQSYDAGITLDITPHISEGDLLRLEILLTRSDFGSITYERPPDTTGSDINTVVTVPDGNTIILGGMQKLNQTKGGSKVPILGDIPIIGGAFRSVSNSDNQSNLYVFVRAEVIRPSETLANVRDNLSKISDRDRAAFEDHEAEFQNLEDWPGVKPKPMAPVKVLDAR